MTWKAQNVNLFTHVLLRVVPLAGLVLVAIWYGASRSIQDTVERQINGHLTRETDRSAARLASQIALMKDAVRSLAGNDLIVTALVDVKRRAAYLMPLVPVLRSLRIPGPPGGTIALIDGRGERIAATGAPASYRGSTILGEVMTGETVVRIGSEGLTIAAPVVHLGRPQGMVVARYTALQLAQLIRLSASGKAIAALDAGSNVIYSSNPAFLQIGSTYPKDGSKGWMTVAVPVPGIPRLSFVGGERLETALVTARELEPYLALKLILSLVTLVVGIGVAAFLVGRALSRVVGQIRKIASEDDLAGRVNPGGPREFQELAGAFNALIAHLEETTTSHEFVDNIISSMSEALIVSDEEGRIQIINMAARNLLSNGEEVIGMHLDDLPLIASSAKLLRFFVYVDPHRGVDAMYADVRTGSGETRIVSWSRSPFSTEGERGFVFVGRDMSARHSAEAALRDSEVRLRSVFETVIDGIITIDHCGTVESINPAAAQIFGYSPDEIIGQNVSMLMTEEDSAAHDGYLKRSLSRGLTADFSSGRDLWGLRRDGTPIPIELAVAAIDVGGARQYTGVVRDITERKHNERIKNEFVSVVSHELRTPLTSIVGSLGLVRGSMSDELPERVNAMLEIAHNNGERLVRLVNDILDLEKIESGRMPLRPEPVDAVQLAIKAISENEGYAEHFNTPVALRNDIGEARIVGDPDRLMQVLTNLLSNAVKFSPEKVPVELIIKRVGRKVRFAVADRGPGIPEEFYERIFKKFEQVDASDSRRMNGSTGLGLSICKLITELHDAELKFNSVVGEGTTFYFEILEYAENPTGSFGGSGLAEAPDGTEADERVSVE